MNCKNCEHTLSNESKFCNNCGAKVVTETLTYGYLASEIYERFFDFENNLILRTFRHLFSRPEGVIDNYINGVRKRHLSVASYLALAITISGLQLFIIQKFFKNLMDATWMGQENVVAQDPGFMDSIWEYQSLFYILFIPLYAIIAKITFWNYKKYNYLKHIVIVSYTQSQMSIALFLPYIIGLSLGFNFFKLNYLFIFVMMMYSTYVYKRLYNTSWGKIIVKLLFFLVLISVALIIWSIIFWIYLIASGTVDFQEMIEAERAKQAVSYIASFSRNWTS